MIIALFLYVNKMNTAIYNIFYYIQNINLDK